MVLIVPFICVIHMEISVRQEPQEKRDLSQDTKCTRTEEIIASTNEKRGKRQSLRCVLDLYRSTQLYIPFISTNRLVTCLF